MSKKNVSGRPKKPAENRKGDYLVLRLTADEKHGLGLAAELAGLQVSSWARERLRRIAAKELQEANMPIPFLKEH